MKPRTKSALLLLATLVVGVLIGAFAASTILSQRVEQLRALRDRGGFAGMIEAVIQPRDEAQQAEIHAVLERSHARYVQVRRRFSEQLKANTDTLRAELAPLLTSEQQQRLDEWLARDRRHRPERGRSGPESRPPPGRPPDR